MGSQASILKNFHDYLTRQYSFLTEVVEGAIQTDCTALASELNSSINSRSEAHVRLSHYQPTERDRSSL